MSERVITWRKGFFRLWAALSIVWIVGTGYLTNLYSDAPRYFSAYGIVSMLEDKIAAGTPHQNSEGTVFSVEEMKRDLIPMKELRDVLQTGVIESLWTVLMPPAVALVLLWLLSWVARGFRRGKT